jgi:hypothetical protein
MNSFSASRSNRRGFLSRIGITRNPRYDEFAGPYSPRSPYSPPYSPPISPSESFSFRLSVSEDGLEDLPPYSPRSAFPPQFVLNAPPSPAYQVVVGETPPTSPLPMMTRFTQPRVDNAPSRNEVIDELVTRLRENLKNPRQWRPSPTGETSFFWALRCNAGTADVILEQLEHIKDKVVLSDDWRVEKFTLIFKGQKLQDLLCRPIQTTKYSHTEPLQDDYFVVRIFKP